MNRTLLDSSLWGDGQRQPLSPPCAPLYQPTLPCLSVCCCSSQHLHINQTSALLQVSDFPEEQLLVAVFPGVPTAAELFLLPNKNQSEGKKKSEEGLEQVWATAITVCWNPISVWRRGDCQRLQTWTAMLFVFNRFLTSLLARWIKIWWSSSSSLASGWSCTTHSWHWVRIVCSQSQLIPPQTFLLKKFTAAPMSLYGPLFKIPVTRPPFQAKQHKGLWVGFDFKWNSLSRGIFYACHQRLNICSISFIAIQPQNERYTESNYVDYLVLENIRRAI